MRARLFARSLAPRPYSVPPFASSVCSIDVDVFLVLCSNTLFVGVGEIFAADLNFVRGGGW